MVTEFFTIAFLHLLAVISPGPDFIMILRNTILYSRKVGIYTSIGLALGILVHITYSLIGIGLLISQSIILFNIIKIAGAGYLIYIGIKSLKARKDDQQIEVGEKKKEISKIQAIKTGFLTNAFNPKATLFFLSIFTLVVSPSTPTWAQMIYGLEMVLMTFIWFTFVATVLSHEVIKNKFVSVQHYFTKVMGALLIGLGIKVAMSSQE